MKKTVLFDKHIKLGAKIVDFAGFKMPISYSSVTDEHNHVRENVGVFDVSHMGEFEISGKNSTQFIQFICSNNIMKLKPGKAQYNCLVNDNGGIIDDLIVYKIDEEKYLLVVNASNIEKNQQNQQFLLLTLCAYQIRLFFSLIFIYQIFLKFRITFHCFGSLFFIHY